MNFAIVGLPMTLNVLEGLSLNNFLRRRCFVLGVGGRGDISHLLIAGSEGCPFRPAGQKTARFQ